MRRSSVQVERVRARGFRQLGVRGGQRKIFLTCARRGRLSANLSFYTARAPFPQVIWQRLWVLGEVAMIASWIRLPDHGIRDAHITFARSSSLPRLPRSRPATDSKR